MRQIVEKRVFGYMNQDDDDKDLKNGAVREIHNMIHSKDGFGKFSRLDLILGTSELANTLPSGTNKNIGSIEDIENNLLYFFNYNSGGLSGIYEYDPTSGNGSIVKIIESPLFPFTSNSFIRGSIVDGMIFFTDNISPPMYINVAFAKAGSYKDTTFREYTYAKIPTGEPPVANRTTDANVIRNIVAHDSYKFAYRYVFFDNGRSKISHYSPLVKADVVPPQSETTNNNIKIEIIVDSLTEHLIKKIEFFYQKNGTGTVFLFLTEDRPTAADGWQDQGLFYPVLFDGTESTTVVPTQELVDQFDNIPRLTSDISIKENRLLMNKALFGHDNNGSPTMDIAAVVNGGGSTSSAKHGGIYTVGVIYEDDQGWISPILKRKSIQIPYQQTISELSSTGIRITMGGTTPDWAVRWHAVVSEEAFYNLYQEVPCLIMLAVARADQNQEEGSVGLGFNEQTKPWSLILGGWVYASDIVPKAQLEPIGINSIHLRMPVNLPFLPEKGMYGRFKNAFMLGDPNLSKEFIVLDVVGDKVYIDSYGLFDEWFNVNQQIINVEFYTKQDVQSGIYNEVSITGLVNNGNHSSNSQIWAGDQHFIDTEIHERLGYLFPSDPVVSEEYSVNFLGGVTPFTENRKVYSPSPTSGGSVVVTADGELLVGGSFITGEITITQIENQTSYTLNYLKIANDRAYAHAEADIEEVRSADVVLYSNPYLPNTLINGLFNIGLLSEFTLGVEDGPVQRMFSIGDRTVLVIHPHAHTSMYMGQGVLRTVAGEDVVSKSSDVIGYSNRAKGRYGSEHPESFAYHDDRVYSWDGNRADIVRYAQDGITALGAINEYKSKLKLIADTRRIAPSYKAYGMYNPEHEMYILVFADASFGQISLPPITIAYSERAGKFVDLFDSYPESGHKIADKLVMFDSGRLFRWNRSTLYDFFGVPFYPKIVLVFNDFSDVQKLALNWVVDSDKPWRVEVRSSTGSESYTGIDEFIESEKNKHYGDVYRDVTSSGAYPDTGSGGSRFNGDTIRGETFTVTLTRDVNEAVSITELLFAYAPMSGHITSGKQ